MCIAGCQSRVRGGGCGMTDEAREFTFAELWEWAMEDADFAAGKIDAEEVFRRMTDPDSAAIRARKVTP